MPTTPVENLRSGLTIAPGAAYAECIEDEHGISPPDTLRYIQTTQVDASSGDVTIDTIRMKKAWRFEPPEDQSGSVVVLPGADVKSKRSRLAFMPVGKELHKFSSTRELCKALYDSLQGRESRVRACGVQS